MHNNIISRKLKECQTIRNTIEVHADEVAEIVGSQINVWLCEKCIEIHSDFVGRLSTKPFASTFFERFAYKCLKVV